jgi:hypothetical protein
VRAVALLGLLFCASAFAENGLAVHFTIKKSAGNETSTYTNGLLMRLTEASTMTFPEQYEMRIESRAVNDGKVDLVVTLKDLSSGKSVYAGSGATTLKVGASQTVSLHQLQSAQASYEIFMDTAYGKLPESAH